MAPVSSPPATITARLSQVRFGVDRISRPSSASTLTNSRAKAGASATCSITSSAQTKSKPVSATPSSPAGAVVDRQPLALGVGARDLHRAG